jgi:hypothetical protein
MPNWTLRWYFSPGGIKSILKSLINFNLVVESDEVGVTLPYWVILLATLVCAWFARRKQRRAIARGFDVGSINKNGPGRASGVATPLN